MQMLDSKSGGTGNFNENPAPANYATSQPQQASSAPQTQPTPSQSPDAPPPQSHDDFDDDIPF